MARVERIEPSKHVKGRYLVFLDTGALLKVGEQELLDFGLRPGLELKEAELARLVSSGQDTAARVRAARMVGARPMSREELERRLVSKGESPEAARKAADWLEELGAIDDEEYAKTIVRHYDRMGYGPQKLRDELYRRRIPRACWASALEEARPQQEAVDAYLAARFRTRTVTPKELQRQANALRRRGFGWEAIQAGLEQYPAEDTAFSEEF